MKTQIYTSILLEECGEFLMELRRHPLDGNHVLRGYPPETQLDGISSPHRLLAANTWKVAADPAQHFLSIPHDSVRHWPEKAAPTLALLGKTV
jgi:hypothetical protein